MRKSVQVLILKGLRETVQGPNVYKVVTGKGNMPAGGLCGQESGLPFSSALKRSKYTDRVPSSQFNSVVFEWIGEDDPIFSACPGYVYSRSRRLMILHRRICPLARATSTGLRNGEEHQRPGKHNAKSMSAYLFFFLLALLIK
jgi:hypothetical protein